MGFQIVTQIKEADLKKVMEIDEIVYSSEYMGGDSHDYVGKIENMQERFRANRQSFVCLMDEESGRLAGYINFFPCTRDSEGQENGLYESILDRSDVIRDDDIRPEEIAPYSTEGNHLFIISVAVHPKYQNNREAAKMLSDGWIGCLNALEEQGYPITDITAAAVSEDGQKWLRNHMFTQYRKLADGNIVYICKDACLERLLENKLYFKSYHDDIYLMLPLADNSKNHRMDELFVQDEDEDEDEDSAEDSGGVYRPESYIRFLRESLRYECTNEVTKELKIANLGSLTFLHTTDEYPQGRRDAGKRIVVGETESYAVLTAHPVTHMYVLTLILPDCRYSTTRVEDQLSYDRLMIRDPDNPARETELYQFLRRRYGLHKCGPGKCLLCMSNKPKDTLEFEHILLGEAYDSLKVDYHVKSREITEMCEQSQAQYDYYDVYLSEMTIAFILKDSEADTREKQIERFMGDVENRIETMATYSFIVEVVMFQNIALAKATTKISNALSNGGDISHEQVGELYRDFGRTVHFWEIHNFKYAGAQAEAEHVARAFGNDKLKANYYEHQEFLEHMVELKSSQIEARNGMIISIVGTILAVIQIMDPLEKAMAYITAALNRFYGGVLNEDVPAAEVMKTSSLLTGIVILTVLAIAVYVILKLKRKNMRRINMRPTWQKEDEVYDDKE